MKRIAAISALMLSIATSASPSDLAAKMIDAVRRADADGCVETQLFCNTTTQGRLAAGDCTTSNGFLIDDFQFAGSAGQFVTITVTPTSPSFTNPVIVLVPPASDASKTPLVEGPAPVTLRYLLASTGTWSIGVSTTDLFATGSYNISLSCDIDTSSEPQNCVFQELACSQRLDWELTSASCRFTPPGNTVFAGFFLPSDVGTTITITAQTIGDFRPRAEIFESCSSAALAFDTTRTNTSATATYTITRPGDYYGIVTSVDDFGVGFFTVNVTCVLPPCAPPVIINQPASVTLPAGSTAFVSVDAIGTAPFHYRWTELGDPLTTIGTDSPQFKTPVLQRTQQYQVVVSNACGSVTSQTATVTVTQPPRRHAAKH
jgi:hypothetical protein